MVPLILASTSKYRQQLLAQLALPFECQKPQFDEEQAKSTFHGTPKELCQHLGMMKAKSLSSANNCVIGSDQMAILENEILGKPHNAEKATKQLQKMQGRTHTLLTSMSVFYKGQEISILNETQLKMRPLSEQQIQNYLKLDQPFDCAGSYKIESHGISLMESIQTDDFTAIQGLPLLQLVKILTNFGYNFPGKI